MFSTSDNQEKRAEFSVSVQEEGRKASSQTMVFFSATNEIELISSTRQTTLRRTRVPENFIESAKIGYSFPLFGREICITAALNAEARTVCSVEGEDLSTVPMWLDCDPGHDDMLAIMLAVHHPGISLIGISTVQGNQTLAKVTDNAARSLFLAGAKRDVIPGSTDPILRAPQQCAEIHGESGLGGLTSAFWDTVDFDPEPMIIRPESPFAEIAQRIISASKARSCRVKLVATGAQTNIAILLKAFPELKKHIEVVFMGGTYNMGNTGSFSEFNIQCDPEAAAIVAASGVPVTMVPLDVTHTVTITEAVKTQMAEGMGATKLHDVLVKLLGFFEETYREVFHFDHPPVHDPCAVLFAVAPELFETKAVHLAVETQGMCAGATCCDMYGFQKQEPNATVCTKLDVPAFWDAMIAALARANKLCPLN